MNTEKETAKNGDRNDGRDEMTTTEYCRRLQEWMWRYYWSCANCMFISAPLFPPPQCCSQTSRTVSSSSPYDIAAWHYQTSNTDTSSADQTSILEERGPAAQAPAEYSIPSLLRRFLAETVDFFILFCVKATIVLFIMHLSGIKDVSRYVMQFIVEEIDENTSLEDLQKMMAVALAYRALVCVYEIICIWGAGGATPGKFLLGLRVVTCDSTVLVQPSRVLVVPGSNVSLAASIVRALNKNFSIAFLFPVFITLLFFQHNRTVYDVVAGTIVVRQRRAR